MQTEVELPRSVEVPLSALAELAVEWWRLERWAAACGQDGSATQARHVARRLSKFLDERGLSVVDLTGRAYEPGLAVEVLDVTGDATAEGPGIIEETITPVVLYRGRVVRHGQVIISRQ